MARTLMQDDFQITTEKLEELKDNIPRAGPKYRLGMYFDTIHNLTRFDDIYENDEDGYTSFWETDTEVDEELGNFIFSNVTGDSASVICIDETLDILSMREQQHQRNQLNTTERPIHTQLQTEPRHYSQPHAQEEHLLERSNESKRSSASRHSRRSHNSGSDGAYDEPPPVPPPRRQTVSPPEEMSPEDHTYESLDDCKDEYVRALEAIYISKGSEGSADSMAKPVVSNDEFDSDGSSTGKPGRSSKSPVQAKMRSSSFPQVPEGVHMRHRRKLSEPIPDACSLHTRVGRTDKVGPKNSHSLPLRGYSHQLPSGIPEDYAAMPNSERRSLNVSPTSTTKRPPLTQPISPERISRTDGSISSSKKTKRTRNPSLFIRHKGQTFFIPMVDKKLQQRLEKVKGPPKTYATPMSQRNGRVNGSVSRSSNGVYSHSKSTLINHSTRSHASPPKMDPCEQATSHKRKNGGKQIGTPKQVIHYGML